MSRHTGCSKFSHPRDPHRLEAQMTIENDTIATAELWKDKCDRATTAHYYSADKMRLRDNCLTIFNVISSISVVSLGSLLATNQITYLSILLTVASVSTVITSVLQYIFDFRARYKDHAKVASEYATVRRKIELAVVNNTWSDKANEIAESMSVISDHSPLMAGSLFRKSQKQKNESAQGENAKRLRRHWRRIFRGS